MRFLRTNTAVIITVGPFYDKTDGVTIETGLTITSERITLTADTDDGSAPTNILDNVTGATSGTANDLNYITGNDAGMMQLELAAADVNRLGRMFLSITDAANHVPVFHEFMVMPALVYDTFFASSGGATFPAATLASTTNITAGVITTVTNLTNAATAGDLTATMKASVTTAVPTAAAIADAVLDEDMTGHQTQGSLGQAIGDPVADTNTIYKAVVTDAAGATVGVDVVAVKGDTAAILLDTAEIGAAGAGLTAINLPDQTMNITGDITGNLSGSVGSVTGAVGSVTGAVGSVTGNVGGNVVGSVASVTGNVGGNVVGSVASVTGNVAGNVTGSIGSLATQAKADVNAEVDTALADINLDHLVKSAVDTNFATTVHADSVVGQIADNGAGFDRTTDSLEAIRDRGDAAWTTATGFSTHSASDVWAVATRVLTAGTNIQLPSNGLANVTAWTVNITGSLSGSVGSVTGLTASNLDATISSRSSHSAADVWTSGTRTLTAATNITSTGGTTVPQTGDSFARIGVAGAGLTALPWNAAWDAEVQSEVTDALTASLTEAYATLGAEASVAQILYEVRALLAEKSVTTTTLTTKKLNGSTTAATYTLNDPTTPTAITRAS